MSHFYKVIDFTVKTFGAIHHLVNCAGIYPSKPALEISEKDWEAVLNLKAPFFLSKAVAEYFIKEKIAGSVTNSAPTAARMGRPGVAAYSSSKARLVMLTRVLALNGQPMGSVSMPSVRDWWKPKRF
ncbi:hypothetical protein GCM10011391_24960 [Pullulanibacillus camelliae]|uniref:SDR family oxidoreductase n=2 Tax=Pullulanibacillus camelliae TaxID=1707096 RepID=A0A8J2YID6_9BACL|nr:hypothetical protein GCM10011391_24960 [Pullulanibacillus camelliae]